MLEHLVAACTDSGWDSEADKNRFWHVAYHALFYLHLCLQPSETDFEPWEKTRPDYNWMGARPFPPHTVPLIDPPYTRAEILDYLVLCRAQIDTLIEQLDLQGPSGFDWLPMNKLELQFYSIRHTMQHIGELGERLGQGYDLDLRWVGMHRED